MTIDLSRYGLEGADKAAELKLIGKAPIFKGAVNLLYAPPGYGKTWNTASMLGQLAPEHKHVLIDSDGSNGIEFVDFCKRYGTTYINLHRAIEIIDKKSWGANGVKSDLERVIDIIERMADEVDLFIIDSFGSVNGSGEINNAEKVAPTLYRLNHLAEKYDIGILLIDHATMESRAKKMDAFKIEGNASGKKKACACVIKFLPMGEADKGGEFIIEKSRNFNLLKPGQAVKVKQRGGEI